MKPLYINLAAKKSIRGNIVFAFVLIFIFAATALTLDATYEYMANKKVIKVYQNRIHELTMQQEQKKVISQKKVTDKKELERIQQNLVYLEGLIEKNMFSLPLLLSEIEKIKPEKVNINEMAFSNNLQAVTIKGRSNFVNAISQFLIALDKSPEFRVELLKEEINGLRQIAFELTLEWKKEEEWKKEDGMEKDWMKNPNDKKI